MYVPSPSSSAAKEDEGRATRLRVQSNEATNFSPPTPNGAPALSRTTNLTSMLRPATASNIPLPTAMVFSKSGIPDNGEGLMVMGELVNTIDRPLRVTRGRYFPGSKKRPRAS